MNRPTICAYCKGTGMADNDNECGFCDAGESLETQEDWDHTWGRVLTGEDAEPWHQAIQRAMRSFGAAVSRSYGLEDGR